MELRIKQYYSGVQSISGEFVTLRALIHTRPQRSFMTELAAQLLGLWRRFSKIHINRVGAGQRMQSKGGVELVIAAKYGYFTTNVSTLMLPNITNLHPSIETQSSCKQDYQPKN